MSFDVPATPPVSSVEVVTVPALSDNFMYLIIDNESKEAAVIDPVKPENLFKEAEKRGAKITTVLTTHSHWDHAGGNKEIASKYPGIHIVGGKGDGVDAVQTEVGQDDRLQIGALPVRVIFTPCHTVGHVCYVVEPKGCPPLVFTGDTMFAAGCGNFNSGTPAMMTDAFEKLGSLPPDTYVYFGHEYTVSNLEYAVFAEPGNAATSAKLDWAKKKCAGGGHTTPSTMAQEHETNPFLRAVTKRESVMNHCSTTNPVDAMMFVRREKSSGIHKRR